MNEESTVIDQTHPTYLRAASTDSILIVDDDASVVQALKDLLAAAGYTVHTATSSIDALQTLEHSPFDIVLSDVKMPEIDGLELVERLARNKCPSTVILMSAHGNSHLALEAIQRGAYDFVAKPIDTDELLLTIRKAFERERLKRENELLRDQVTKRYSFDNIVAQSPSMLDIFQTIKKVADYSTTITILGESGTGKELIARALHFNSARRQRRFVAINCGAIPENLLESELFGHKRGAFTDATRDKKGLFEEADGGTLFLDEIGELPTHLQVKLLRVLQDGEIRPVGDNRVLPVDVRVIAATLRNLEQDVLDGRFREDLYYRLNVVSLQIPPLRERKEDIPILVNHFLKKNREKLGVSVYGIAHQALERLLEYRWPGNVRELENCIERAMILTDGNEITLESLPKNLRQSDTTDVPLLISGENLSIKEHSRQLEQFLIQKALEHTAGNRTRAAKLLEISHRTLLYKLKEYNLGDGD